MRRFNRIVLLVVIVVGAAIVIAYGGLSATLSRVATREASKFLAQLPEGIYVIKSESLTCKILKK